MTCLAKYAHPDLVTTMTFCKPTEAVPLDSTTGLIVETTCEACIEAWETAPNVMVDSHTIADLFEKVRDMVLPTSRYFGETRELDLMIGKLRRPRRAPQRGG